MDNTDLLRFNEKVLADIDSDSDKIFKLIIALECVLDFENFKAFDGIRLCKYTDLSYEELETYLDLLVEQNIILRMETDSLFTVLYKLNYESKNISDYTSYES